MIKFIAGYTIWFTAMLGVGLGLVLLMLLGRL